MKMKINNIFDIKLNIPTKIKGNPKWAKDGLKLAFEDDLG